MSSHSQGERVMDFLTIVLRPEGCNGGWKIVHNCVKSFTHGRPLETKSSYLTKYTFSQYNLLNGSKSCHKVSRI